MTHTIPIPSLGGAVLLAAGLILAGCATAPPPKITYVQARPVLAPPEQPAVIEVPRPLPLAGQLQPIPGPNTDRPKCSVTSDEAEGCSDGGDQIPIDPDRPWTVIDGANQKATQNPDPEGYFNAIMLYDFAPGALYQVYAAPLKLTDIALQPGETLLGQPACGDTVRWVLGQGQSKEADHTRLHLYLKPTRPGLHTTLTITTDRRTYYLELHSYITTYMASVSWRYPHDELDAFKVRAETQKQAQVAVTATQVQLDQLNFHYDIEVEDGDPQDFKPLKVFDDGKKTFIQFPPKMRFSEAPALFILSEDDQLQLVNYRKKNDFYIVDRLFKRAELRLGQKDPAVVRIERHKD